MFSFVKWFNEYIYYYFSDRTKEQLITQITDEKNKIQPILRQDLMASIILDHPKKFIDQMAQLPDKVRDELMDTLTHYSAE